MHYYTRAILDAEEEGWVGNTLTTKTIIHRRKLLRSACAVAAVVAAEAAASVAAEASVSCWKTSVERPGLGWMAHGAKGSACATHCTCGRELPHPDSSMAAVRKLQSRIVFERKGRERAQKQALLNQPPDVLRLWEASEGELMRAEERLSISLSIEDRHRRRQIAKTRRLKAEAATLKCRIASKHSAQAAMAAWWELHPKVAFACRWAAKLVASEVEFEALRACDAFVAEAEDHANRCYEKSLASKHQHLSLKTEQRDNFLQFQARERREMLAERKARAEVGYLLRQKRFTQELRMGDEERAVVEAEREAWRGAVSDGAVVENRRVWECLRMAEEDAVSRAMQGQFLKEHKLERKNRLALEKELKGGSGDMNSDDEYGEIDDGLYDEEGNYIGPESDDQDEEGVGEGGT